MAGTAPAADTQRAADARPARAGAGFASAVSALVRKDLRLELRTRESVPAMFLFSLSTFVLFRFGLDRESLEGDLASGVLWVTLLFAAVLGMNRLFVAEREEGGFDAFLLAPVTAPVCSWRRPRCCSGSSSRSRSRRSRPSPCCCWAPRRFRRCRSCS